MVVPSRDRVVLERKKRETRYVVVFNKPQDGEQLMTLHQRGCGRERNVVNVQDAPV